MTVEKLLTLREIAKEELTESLKEVQTLKAQLSSAKHNVEYWKDLVNSLTKRITTEHLV